jgi:Co/Zn/Cd efflux system component
MRVTEIAIARMDCPSEVRMLRDALEGDAAIVRLDVDLPARRVTVTHDGEADAVVSRIGAIGLGAELIGSRPSDPQSAGPAPVGDAARERRVLRLALAINATMFVIELAAGLAARSAGLVSDSLDMFADAAVYGVSLYAVGRARTSKLRAARLSGWLQMALAAGALAEVVRRFLGAAEPEPLGMIGVAVVALAANVATLRLLSGERAGGVHMKASWIFTTNDVLANLGVVAAGVLVHLTGSRVPDLAIGTLIALLVASGAVRILRLRG